MSKLWMLACRDCGDVPRAEVIGGYVKLACCVGAALQLSQSSVIDAMDAAGLSCAGVKGCDVRPKECPARPGKWVKPKGKEV